MTSLAQSKPMAASRTEPDEESPRPSCRVTRLALRRKEFPAMSTARSPRPADANPDDDDSTVYVLRNRRVLVPKRSNEPVVPKSSEPVVPKSKRYPSSAITVNWVGCFPGEDKHAGQTLACAKLALEHYNRMNQEDEHELAAPLNSSATAFKGFIVHVNFLAKRKGGTNCLFFGEVQLGRKDEHTCFSCVKMGPGVATESGCTGCPEVIVHPAEFTLFQV